MARLRFAVLLAASCGVLLLAASASSSSRPPEVYSVGDGDETGRAGNDDDGTQTLRKWAMTQRFSVGDDTMQRFNVGDVLGKL